MRSKLITLTALIIIALSFAHASNNSEASNTDEAKGLLGSIGRAIFNSAVYDIGKEVVREIAEDIEDRKDKEIIGYREIKTPDGRVTRVPILED